jgi:hypothetical protein
MQIFLDAWGGLIFESASSAHLMLLFAIISTGRGNWLDSGIEEMFVFFFFLLCMNASVVPHFSLVV